MALLLDPILAGAQDSMSRKPIVEIISAGTVADIPFDGQQLFDTLTNEQKPNVITHSSGRLCLIYTFGNAFRYVYTDPARTEFHSVDISVTAGQTAVEATLCEVDSGHVGIVYYSTTGANQILRRMIISPTGEILTAVADIQSYGATHHILSAPFVVRLANGSYFLVYAHKNIDDGNTYSISKRTSTDFVTWSPEGTCSIGGLTATKRIDNPSLLQISTGQMWVWFDYLDDVSGSSEMVNIYFSTSDDNGSTWAAAAKFTDYTTYGTVGRHPFAFQKVADQMHLLFYEQTGALHMDWNQSGYCGPKEDGGDALQPSNITYDAVHRKIYVVSSYTQAGIRSLLCVFRVDLDTWTIDACWNSSTVPPFPEVFTDGPLNLWWCKHHGEGSLIPISAQWYIQSPISLLDGEADTITNFFFRDWPEKGITRNVNWADEPGAELVVTDTWIDQATMRLYCLLVDSYVYHTVIMIGYFDLTEDIGPTGGYHTFNEIVRDINQATEPELIHQNYNGSLQVLPDYGLIILSLAGDTTGTFWPGRIRIYNLADGSLYKEYRTATHPNFPYHGLRRARVVGGKIYGGFIYDTIYSEGNKRGLCIIDINSDAITFQRPTWATIDDYRLFAMAKISDTSLAITSIGHGVTIYDIPTATWILYDDNSLPGLGGGEPGFKYEYLDIACDAADGLLFTGSTGQGSGTFDAFSIYGFIRQGVYRVATYAAGWTWGALNDFLKGIVDYESVAALHPTDRSIYAFWTEQAKTELSLKWDKEASTLDLSPYLATGHEIATSRKIDGSPSTLSFSVSHGYLFDPHNPGSLFSIYLRKTRKLTLRMGENVSGVNYWQNMGTFFVKATALSYEREQYPLMEVQAEDIRSFWEDATIIATASFSTTPKEVMEAILTSHAGLSAPDMQIPVFDGSSTLYHQWVEVQLKEILDQIANRFSYFVRATADGKISSRKISDANPIDHTYSGKTWMVKFTPDDSYSNVINQVIVVGETHDLIDLLFAEEPIKMLNGTVGWWGGKKEIEVWYSDDHMRRCQAPRLEVILSVSSFNFKLGGGNEKISSVRSDNLGCTVTIDLPNMVAMLVATIAAIAALAYYCLGCDPKVLGYGGWCGWCIFTLVTLIGMCLNILGSLANYQYQIHAQPWGQVRQTVQGIHDDEALQAEMGFIASNKIEDPLCYTVDQCKFVADNEAMVAAMQRNRITLTKLAHLQDEEGDTIQVNHPHSDLPLKIFITNLTRRLQIPSSANSEDGHFLDDLEGCKIS